MLKYILYLFLRVEKPNLRATLVHYMQPLKFSPISHGAILALLRVTGTIVIAQPLLILFNKDPTEKCLSSDYIQENGIWYYSESKTIDVHCRGAKMYFPIFSDMLFWEACGKNVKYYEL